MLRQRTDDQRPCAVIRGSLRNGWLLDDLATGTMLSAGLGPYDEVRERLVITATERGYYVSSLSDADDRESR